MIISGEFNTNAEAWRFVVKQFGTHGMYINDTKAIDGIIVTKIKNPTDRVEKNPAYGQLKIDEYKKQFLDPNRLGFEYTYGNRLNSYEVLTKNDAEEVENDDEKVEKTELLKVNQIDYIIKTLQKDKTSRRALGVTWQPWIDEYKEDVPCLQLIKCRLLKNRLHMEVVFRSHDMFLGYYPNTLGLSYLMDYIAEHLGAQKGTLTVVSLSPHVYHKRDGDMIRQLVKINI